MSMIHGDPIHLCLLVSVALYVPKYEPSERTGNNNLKIRKEIKKGD